MHHAGMGTVVQMCLAVFSTAGAILMATATALGARRLWQLVIRLRPATAPQGEPILMKFARTFLPALTAAAALLVAGCGDDNGSNTAAPSAGNPVDRAFVAQMIPHHHSAVQMAKIAKRRGQSMFVKQLAGDIVRTQTKEVATMRSADQRLRSAGVKKGALGVPEHMMGMNGDMAKLNDAKPVDRAFLRMMIPHHEGAVVMANAELKKGKDPMLKRLAHNIIATQQREIRLMRQHLDEASTIHMPADTMHGTAHSD
jgi:uncharacterized protein (DUF305 family)